MGTTTKEINLVSRTTGPMGGWNSQSGGDMCVFINELGSRNNNMVVAKLSHEI